MFKSLSDSLLEKVLCSISEPAVVFNENMRVVWTNPSAELYFGHSSEFMAGKRCNDLFHGVLECFDNCPVEKSIVSMKQETLAADGVFQPVKLIDTIPFADNGKNLILSIILSVPEVDRDRALRRDFAALLNRYQTLNEAAEDVLNALQNLAAVQICGVYSGSNKEFRLLKGHGAPDVIKNLNIDTPVYLSGSRLPFENNGGFSEGAAFAPVPGPDGKARALLFAGRGTMSTKFRNRFEMMADVLSSCILRLTSS